MTTLKKSIINKLNRLGYDKRNWNKHLNAGWATIKVYGKLRVINKIEYHFDGFSMIVDDVEFKTI